MKNFDSQDDRGRMPRILEVELVDDLVGSCMPGDDVTVVGIIKVNVKKSHKIHELGTNFYFLIFSFRFVAPTMGSEKTRDERPCTHVPCTWRLFR